MTIVAFTALSLLAYTYVGYPILVALLAKLRPQKIQLDDTWLPTVTVCIPVYNASTYVRAKLDSLMAQTYPADLVEILVYSDGSTDDVADIVKQYPRVTFIDHKPRQGKPTALNEMRKIARGEVLLLTDIRQPLAPNALRAMIMKLADPSVACVSGNLVLQGSTGAGVYWKYETWIRNSEARFRSMVGVTGPIYVIRKADLPEVPTDLILDDQWIPMRLRLAGRRLLLAFDAEAYDDAFGDEREFGRKVRTLAGNYQLFRKMPRLLVPFLNPSWFETFSHKILRLVGPWAMVVLFVSTGIAAFQPQASYGLPLSLTMRALFGCQILFYLAATVGEHAGRVSAVARSFVVLNAAAVLGFWRWVRGSQKVTW